MKNLNWISKVLVLVFALGPKDYTWAHFDKPVLATFAKHADPGKTDVVASGRDEDVFEINQVAIQDVDQALDLLGISRPPHRIEFMPSEQLMAMAVMGRPAVGHWLDGSIIATQGSSRMGVMEFVTPGRPTCRSFYSDRTTPADQVDVFKHVGGHNDFFVNSPYETARKDSDSIADSHLLYEVMENAYLHYDFDEVAQWYQYLQTLSSAQDYARGSYEAPESLKRDPFKRVRREPTPHELQYLVGNFPPDLPQWKKEMAILFEKIEKVTPPVIATKIMNEGWATFVEELLTPHLPVEPYQSHFYNIESAVTRSGVAYPSLSNPYWLGREAWKNQYRKFNERPEIQKLPSLLEKDQAFVKHAHSLIRTMGDYVFLRESLDEEWVVRNNLFLYRKADYEELDPNLPQPKKPNQEQKIVISSAVEEVVAMLVRKIADHSLRYPTVKVESDVATGRNVLSLVHEVIEDIPLEPTSAIKAMYIRAQVWQRPVSLKTVAPSSWARKRRTSGMRNRRSTDQKITLSAVRIEVDPAGLVSVFLPGKDKGDSEVLAPEFSEFLQKSVDDFKEDLAGSINDNLLQAQSKRFAPFLTAMVNGVVQYTNNVTTHSSTAATAVLRYTEMVQRRFYIAMKRALEGKTQLKKHANGARLKVLPEIPEFRLDLHVKSQLDAQSSSAKRVGVENLNTTLTMASKIQIGSGQGGRPVDGDRFWGDAEPQGKGGGGDGDNDDEADGDAQEGEEDSADGGGKPRDPTEIDIPLSLVGEFINESVQLPNLRPKSGRSPITETELDGSQKRPYGKLLPAKVVKRAAALGLMAEAKRRKTENASQAQETELLPLIQHDKKDLLKAGMSLLSKRDWFVPGVAEVPEPDVNAVVVFWMDMTGSMSGEPVKMAKQFVFNLKALLSTKYKKITYRYVGFADQGFEFKTEKSFFSQFLGGGTDYASGIRKTIQILNEYSPQQWDRYSFGIGDAEDGNSSESSNALKELVEISQFTGFVQTDVGGAPDPNFMGAVHQLEKGDYFGFSILRPLENGIAALKKLFKK